MRIDTSQLQTYISCPFKYFNKYRRQIRKRTIEEPEQTRDFGRCAHASLATYFQTKDILQATDLFRQTYMNIEGEKIRTVENGVKLIQRFIPYWKANFGNAEILGIEVQDTFKIEDIEYIVKIDMIMRLNNNTYIVDFKTTTSMTHYFFLKFDPNMHVSAYCDYALRKYGQCSGFIPIALQLGYVDRARLFKLEQESEASNYEVNEVKYSKYHKEDRIYASGFNCKFDYDIIGRTREQLLDFEQNVTQWAKLLPNSTFPKNEGNCMGFKGCQYRDLCKSCDDESVRENLYEKYNAYEYLEEGSDEEA